MKGKTLLSLILILGLSMGATAAADSGFKYGGYGGISLGALAFDPQPINDWLADAGVQDIPSVIPVFGGGGHAILFERVIVGLRGAGFSTELRGDYLDADFNGGYGFLDVGYVAINHRRWILAPVLGIGGAGANLKLKGDLVRFGIWEEPEEDRTDSVGSQKASLGWGYLIGHTGLSFHHVVPFTETSAYGAVLFGLSVGAVVQLTRNAYEDKDISDPGALPSLDFNGAYVQLEINFGGGIDRDPIRWRTFDLPDEDEQGGEKR